MDEHHRHSKLPLVPTVILPTGEGIQDSTPIIEMMELEFPEPSIHPPSALPRFISELLEEFADEWGNKWMMHFRWYASTSAVDAEMYARRIAIEMRSGTGPSKGLQEQLTMMANAFK